MRYQGAAADGRIAVERHEYVATLVDDIFLGALKVVKVGGFEAEIASNPFFVELHETFEQPLVLFA